MHRSSNAESFETGSCELDNETCKKICQVCNYKTFKLLNVRKRKIVAYELYVFQVQNVDTHRGESVNRVQFCHCSSHGPSSMEYAL